MPTGPTNEGTTELTDDVASRSAENLAAAILQRAKDRNDCYGRYCLVIHGNPQIPKPTSTIGKQLVKDATQFVDVTGTARSHDGEILWSDERGQIAIEKQERNCGSRVIVWFRLSQ